MKLLTIFILTLFISSPIAAQKGFAKEEQRVQETVMAFFDALSARDSVRLKSFCAPDILLLEYGAVWNLDTLIRRAITANTAADFKRKNSIDFINTSVDNRTAYTIYNLHSEVSQNGKQMSIHWLETVVAVKENDRWKIKVLHSTRLKQE